MSQDETTPVPLASTTPIRDADWYDAELARTGVVNGERIHLTRKLRSAPGAVITACYITTDFDGWIMEGCEPEIAATWSSDTGMLLPGGSWNV